jgi:phosphoglycerate dehydrogenase-like enzyme
MSSPIKVAVLDDYQNLSETPFKALDPTKYSVTVFRDTLLPFNHPSATDADRAKLIERLKPYTIISSMRERTPFPGALLKQLPNLKLLLSTAGRNLSLDLVTAKELGIPVAGAPGKGRTDSPQVPLYTATGPDSTTQHCVALILGVARNLASDHAVVQAGGWQNNVTTSLSGKTLGLVGYGRLGVAVAKIMNVAFGMKLIAWSSSLTQEAADEKVKSAGLPVDGLDGEKTVKVVSKEELFKTADFVSVHYVLSDRSRGIVAKADLDLMKPSSFLINTSRGPLVVQEDLLATLKAGKIRGAAMDVFDLEPLPQDSEWRTIPWGIEGRSHVLLSPHMGYVEENTMRLWYEEVAENIERWCEGKEVLHSLY